APSLHAYASCQGRVIACKASAESPVTTVTTARVERGGRRTSGASGGIATVFTVRSATGATAIVVWVASGGITPPLGTKPFPSAAGPFAWHSPQLITAGLTFSHVTLPNTSHSRTCFDPP